MLTLMDKRRFLKGFLALLLLLNASLVSGQPVIRLGFLLPYPDGDSDIPVRLAQEWISAVRVALEVLGKDYASTFTVEPFVQNSHCDFADAAQGAQRLVVSQVVGVVGPACSDAVIGASSVLKPLKIPLISFAATAEALSDPTKYPTVFRTSYNDFYQARAIFDTIEYFSAHGGTRWKQINLFHTSQTYGLGLSGSISKLAVDKNYSINPIAIDYPIPEDGNDNYRGYFQRIPKGNAAKYAINVFTTTPRVAANLFKAALESKLLDFPQWYIGSDGVVAFDLVGNDLGNLVSKLQGELGVAPYKGDYNPNRSPFNRFKTYWTQKTHSDYPGLLTLDTSPRLKVARAYVTNLIDAVWTYFEIFQTLLLDEGVEVSPDAVLACLKAEDCVNFKGASGQVWYNNATGDRGGNPSYSIMNLIGLVWNEKTRWNWGGKNFNINLDYVKRPGPIPDGYGFVKQAEYVETPPGQAEDASGVNPTFKNFSPSPPFPPPPPTNAPRQKKSNGVSGGAIAGLVIVVLIAIAALGYGGYYFYKKKYRHPDHQQFVRML